MKKFIDFMMTESPSYFFHLIMYLLIMVAIMLNSGCDRPDWLVYKDDPTVYTVDTGAMTATIKPITYAVLELDFPMVLALECLNKKKCELRINGPKDFPAHDILCNECDEEVYLIKYTYKGEK